MSAAPAPTPYTTWQDLERKVVKLARRCVCPHVRGCAPTTVFIYCRCGAFEELDRQAGVTP